jgi:hypothetical protein
LDEEREVIVCCQLLIVNAHLQNSLGLDKERGIKPDGNGGKQE